MFNFTRTRAIGALAVASGAAVIAMAPGIASAATGATAAPAGVSHSQVANKTAVPPNSDFDFREPGVRIYQPGNGTITSKVAGLGYPGQGLGSDDGPEYGKTVKCDNGQTTNVYVHGENRTTHVVGDVPYCNLVRLR